jgi:hypothetical protein
MANELKPTIDQWYSRQGSAEVFRVVAVDDGAIEIQNFEGDVEEVDLEVWEELDIALAEPPDDWTGPFDNIEADDIDDTDSAMRRNAGHARVEPQFAEGQGWQQARPTDELEDERHPTGPDGEDVSEDPKDKAH